MIKKHGSIYQIGFATPGEHVVAEKQERDGEMDVVAYNPLGSLSLSQQRARLPVFTVTTIKKIHLLFSRDS